MTELERAAQQFANPLTGEALILDSPDADLAAYLADIREFESLLKEYKALVNRELLARMDKRRTWTIHTDGGKLSAPSDEPGEEWDGAGLHEALCELVDEDVITIDAVNAAVEMVVSYKVKAGGVKALRKNPQIAERIEQFCEPAERPRYVKVSRG